MFTVWSTNFDADEFRVMSEPGEVIFRELPVLSSQALNYGNEEMLREALRGDLIIFSSSGHHPRNTIHGLMDMLGEREWRQRRAKIVLRTQDSHHQLQDELAILDEIDVLAVAHSNYLKYFPPHKVLYVPCSLHQTRSVAAKWLEETPMEKDIDVVFPFQLYRGETRNALAYEVWKTLNKKGFSTRFGFFRYYRNEQAPPVLWEELGRARVILNLPLRDDFNIRNFEASLFPAWHITPKLPDHDLVSIDWSNTRFVEPNASKIVSVIEESLETTQSEEPSPTPRETVLQHHTSNDRIYHIIDAILETNLHQQPKDFKEAREPNKKPPITILYGGRELLGNSPGAWSKTPSNSLFTPSGLLKLKATLVQLVLLPGRVLGKLKKP